MVCMPKRKITWQPSWSGLIFNLLKQPGSSVRGIAEQTVAHLCVRACKISWKGFISFVQASQTERQKEEREEEEEEEEEEDGRV